MGEQSWLRTSSFDDCCRSLERKKKRRKNKSLIRREAPFRFKRTIALEIPNQRRAHPWRKLKLRMMRESVWKKKRRKNKVAAAQDKQAIPHYTSPFNDVISPFQERRTASSSRHSSKYSRRYYLAVIRLVSQWKTLLFCETGTQRKCPGPLSTSLFILRKKRISFKVGSPPITMHGMLLLGPKDTTNSIEHSASNESKRQIFYRFLLWGVWERTWERLGLLHLIFKRICQN